VTYAYNSTVRNVTAQKTAGLLTFERIDKQQNAT